MSKLNFKGKLTVDDQYIETGLSLLQFVEDNVVIIYSAELDLTGSGYDVNEAKASFWETLSEFIRYGVKKGTLSAELKRLGWKIKGNKKNRKIISPDFNEVFNSNEEFKDIILNKDYRKFTEKVHIPQFA
jgi:hypothetical protein